MKRTFLSFLYMALISFGLNAACCADKTSKECCQAPSSCCDAKVNCKQQQPSVEVIYFHGKQRCATCLSIEKQARELINEVYASKVNFSVVDFSTEEGKTMATDFKVSFSSLFVVSRKNGKEERIDLSRIGFQYAKNDPEEFKRQLLEAIQLQLDK